MSALDDERKPHTFRPDYMMGGDCVTCGNTRAVCEEMERKAMSDHSELAAGLRGYARLEASEAVMKRLPGTPDALQDADAHDGRAKFFSEAAAALTAQAEEIARLTRERDEAQAKERERCAKIVEEETEVITGHAGIIYDENARECLRVHGAFIAAAIRGGKP